MLIISGRKVDTLKLVEEAEGRGLPFFFFVLHENVLVLGSRELQATSLTPVLQ